MKKTILTFIILIVTISIYAQNDPFRVDCTYMCFWNNENEQWDEWQEANVTFVFNINSNSDFLFYNNTGDVKKFRKISLINKLTTNDGMNYQTFDALNENGEKVTLAFYDNGVIILIFNNFIVKFT